MGGCTSAQNSPLRTNIVPANQVDRNLKDMSKGLNFSSKKTSASDTGNNCKSNSGDRKSP